MQHIFLAYGEGQFAQTGLGVFFSLAAVVAFAVSLIVYAANTYPADRK